MFRGFWDNLAKPIIGLAPMDGVTDAAYRFMVASNGKPAVIMTEFTNVEGLSRGAISMLEAFIYHEVERPIVAQIYGVEVESFYKVALMVCELGFDGIDINMGCPANKVARRGSGAGLIKTPELAKEIIRTVKKAAQDWANGMTLEKAGIRPKIIKSIRAQCHSEQCEGSPPSLQKISYGGDPSVALLPQDDRRVRRLIPVSVKTRTGFDAIVTEDWIKHLLEAEPANISLHGRTLKQMYTGEAKWEEIGKAARVCKGTQTTLLGNGDIKTMEDAHAKIKTYALDGVLVGRGTFGNPWFFKGQSPTPQECIAGAIDHSEAFERVFKDRPFMSMRKHLSWYIRGFDGAKEVRVKLMQTNCARDVRSILQPLVISTELKASGEIPSL